jgi:hypothetical protein
MIHRSILLGVASLVGCSAQHPPAPAPRAVAECTPDKSRDVDHCVEQAASARLAPELCDRIADANIRAQCLANVARSTLRVDLCAQARGLAVDAGVLVGVADQCTAAIASEREDPKPCADLTLAIDRSNCIVSVAEKRDDFDLCSEATEAVARSNCQSEIANRKHDAKLCERLESAESRDFCFWQLAQDTEDGALCARSELTSNRERCYRDLAAKVDVTLCEHIGSDVDSPPRRQCYSSAIVAVRTSSLCPMMPSPATREDCVSFVGASTRDGLLCSTLRAGSARDKCWDGVAGQDNAAACFAIQEGLIQQGCARRTWRSSENPSICALVPAAERNACQTTQLAKAR